MYKLLLQEEIPRETAARVLEKMDSLLIKNGIVFGLLGLIVGVLL